jgi:D-glycero-D-manno-heptose 1,7-bisphosphate phosphatase
MNRAIFFDRDGTLILEKNYLHRAEDVTFFPGALEGLKRLSEGGFQLIMVTNQSGVGRGYFTLTDVEKVHAFIADQMRAEGFEMAKVYIAPEAPDQPSRGRKPSPAFLFDARDEWGVSLGESYMIGDKLIDLQSGWNAGIKKSILVRTGYGAGFEKTEPQALKDAVIVDDLASAADFILRDIAPA